MVRKTFIDLKGDDAPEPIWLQVGKALSHWENAETLASLIYANLLSDDGMEAVAAQLAHGLIPSAQRNLMLKEVNRIVGSTAMFVGRNPGIKEQIDTVISRMGALGDKRNEIAHGTVTEFEEDGKKLGFFLAPAYYNTKSIMVLFQRFLTIDTIRSQSQPMTRNS